MCRDYQINSMRNKNGDSCASYVAITMNSDLDLTVYTNRGRPRKADTLRSTKKLKKDLRELKEKMNYKDGTEILLALSVATDEMSRHVHMFPEVFYLDVTANTNKLKKDIFLMVIKDSNGQTFVGNVTAIPSGKRWVYNMIYKHFFLQLYGEVTIGRNRLALTDDDVAEWGPLDNAINTMQCWYDTRHMLCSFHAVTLMFFKEVHPKLPHKGRDKQRRLTDEGKQYGKCSNVLLYRFSFDPCI